MQSTAKGEGMVQAEKLFENVERVEKQEAQAISEKHGALAYLQYSKQSKCIQRCRWFEEWFAQYPQEHKQKLKDQLKSKKWEQFIGALFELEIYRVLHHQLGCKVQIEPNVSDKTPDFLAICEGERFYVEATVRHDAEADSSNRRHAEEFTDMLRAKLKNLHSDLWIDVLGSPFPERNADWKTARGDIQKWLDEHNAEEEDTAYRHGGLVRRYFYIGQCRIIATLRPYRRRRKARVTEPGLAIQGSGVESLRTTVKKKAKRYKSQDFKDLPYIVAVNLNAVSSEGVQCTDNEEYNEEVAADADTDVARALCGSDSLTEREFLPGLGHVNGVIVVHNGTLGNEKIAGVKLYRNGNATIPKCLQFLLDYNSFGSLLGLS